MDSTSTGGLNFLNVAIILLAFCLLSGCVMETNYAPVTDISTIDAIPHDGMHTVKSGETLYSIAWKYGVDYRMLATKNRINPPYAIVPGQKVTLTSSSLTPAKIAKKYVEEAAAPVNPIQLTGTPWIWPAKGNVIGYFAGLQKGINISGQFGEPIYAAASGRVVYSGDGLRGYGNLIIIKHNSLYLSAYAHNKYNLVKEGELVTQGQKIAEMGNSGTVKTMLHFEIRHAGQPIDPMGLLPS